ncbi:transposase IS4 family protein [Planctopirus limnophila DSM 3776]|uniref:Transposase IS4 family protein n=1 Tax=Planctopirus limnophila (strain ATCC 43296 / DSM 3776 / IFAM 1008 / Mu 290) TaxID=521674 RepID=D5STB9_PLAL2|nr:IS4 family transposase [Planctopirus limnophila]ADG66887.1 transposase IS4 family protein [Planctopirus limnophila DSM 3776]
MSFTSRALGRDRSFELVKQSFWQDEGLPFSDALTTRQLEEVFEAEEVSFGRDPCVSEQASIEDGGLVYTRGVTLWAMLSQALFTDVQRACRAAVQRVAVYYALSGIRISSTNTGAYCRARAKIPEGVVQRLAVGVGQRCEAAVPDKWRWHGFRTLVIDGTTCSMPDTQENQAEYPQPSSQGKGLGFPILRAVALTSLATGMILALVTGPCAGKATGETALFRTLFDQLKAGDLVLSDRYYGGWFMLALLQELGVEFVTRLHQFRIADFHQGKRLGQRDHVVAWAKPQKPAWLDQATYDRLPDQLEVREIEVQVPVPGFRTASLVVVTSLRDHRRFPREELALLYRRRWTVELELRDIKATMDLAVLRCTKPAWVRQELWTGLLAYNLIRQSMLQSALGGEVRPEQLSFAASLTNAGQYVVAGRDAARPYENRCRTPHCAANDQRLFASCRPPPGSNGAPRGQTPPQSHRPARRTPRGRSQSSPCGYQWKVVNAMTRC